MSSIFQVDAIISILDALLNVAHEIRKQLSSLGNRIVPKLAKGISLLPDELLAQIFKFAVWDEGRFGQRQAIWLSHVSRRFRSVALEERGLWTSLSLCSTHLADVLATVVSRSGGNEGFYAFIHHVQKFGRINTREFISLSESTVPRWRGLTVSQGPKDQPFKERSMFGGTQSVLYELQEFAEQGMAFPCLEELDIQGDIDSYYGAKLSWRSPNLRLLRCSYYVPRSSIMFTSITTFAFTQSVSCFGYIFRIEELLAFVPSMPNLASFKLVLQFEDEIREEDPEHLRETICPALTSLQIHLQGFSPREHELQEAAIASLFEALHTPVLENLIISVSLGSSESRVPRQPQPLNLLLRALLPFPKPYSRSRLSTITCKLSSNHYKKIRSSLRSGDAPLEAVLKSIAFPLERIPNVSSLTMSTSIPARFIFDRPHENRTGGGPSNLHEIKFSCCEDMGSEDLGRAVLSLQDSKVWDTIRSVVVENCDRLDYEEVVNVVGKERLKYSRIKD